MKVSNEVYKKVTIDWANVTLPLKEGSPVSMAGVVANNGNAIGLVPQNYLAEPLMKSIYVLVGGDVDLAEVNAKFGSNLTSAAKGNMAGIRFWNADGTIDKSSDTAPAATTDAAGIVKQAENIAESEATTVALLKADFNDLLDALKEAGIMEADPEEEADPEGEAS